jgi:hypothetical protein
MIPSHRNRNQQAGSQAQKGSPPTEADAACNEPGDSLAQSRDHLVCWTAAEDGSGDWHRLVASRWGGPTAHPALVLLRDPSGKRSPFALFCTDPTVPMLQLIAWYVSRWNIEVTFLRSPRPSRLGNAAAVEYSGHCTDHSLPVRVVQPRGPHGPCSPPRSFANPASCLVSQS